MVFCECVCVCVLEPKSQKDRGSVCMYIDEIQVFNTGAVWCCVCVCVWMCLCVFSCVDVFVCGWDEHERETQGEGVCIYVCKHVMFVCTYVWSYVRLYVCKSVGR